MDLWRFAGRGAISLCKSGWAVPTVTVPVPDHEELKIGTLLGIIRQSGLPRELFEVKQ
jgi:hypothetical protein